MPLQIKLCSLLVEDQEKALTFYTKILGFVKKTEIDFGNGTKWLTVVSTESDHVELVLEPVSGMEASKIFQKALFDKGIAAKSFQVDDIHKEYQRLTKEGVIFSVAPVNTGGGVQIAVFDDTCGNRIQIYQSA